MDRYSKYTVLEKLPTKQAVPVRETVVARLKEPDFPVHTMTFDNGKEFARHQEICSELNTQCFFARPYHSWERGLNEHIVFFPLLGEIPANAGIHSPFPVRY